MDSDPDRGAPASPHAFRRPAFPHAGPFGRPPARSAPCGAGHRRAVRPLPCPAARHPRPGSARL